MRKHRTPRASASTHDDARTGDGWLRWLWRYVAAHPRLIVVSTVAAVGWVVTVTAVPLIQKVIVDDVVLADTAPFLPWLLVLLGVAAARFATSAVWRHAGARLSFEVQLRLRDRIYDRLQRLDLAGHTKLESGQLVARANTDLTLAQQLVSWLPHVVANLLKLVFAFAVMAWLSPVLALVVAAVLSLVFFVVRGNTDRVYATSFAAQQREADMTAVVEEATTGVRVVKGFGQESTEQRHLTDAVQRMFRARMRAVRTRAPFLAGLQVVPALGQVAVLVVGGLLVMRGSLTIGTFLAFAGYLADLNGSARFFGSVLTMGTRARTGVERIAEIIGLSPRITDPTRPSAPEAPADDVQVRFTDVRFAYPVGGPVLDGFDLAVRRGETVALVGPSGCGKSTALALIRRAWDTEAGSVAVNGRDVRQWPVAQLRRRVATAFEESFLFSDSIAENIAYGAPDATRERVEQCARAADAHDFIAALPDGYDTVVGEQGLTLSGGQRQRIALARALLADPDVLLLDDATSSIDADVEQTIHDRLAPLLAGRTTVLVAHRESTVRLADRVVLMDRGRVVDSGQHDELLARSALYRRLFGDVESAQPADGAALLTQARRGEYTVTPDAWRPDEAATYDDDGLTPEVRTRLSRVPEAPDRPRGDLSAVAADPSPFSLRRLLRPEFGALAVGLLLVTGDALATLAGPPLVRFGIDAANLDASLPLLLTACAVFAVIVLLAGANVWATQVWTGRTTERLLVALRLRVFGQLQRLGMDYYDTTQAGRVITRMTSDVDSIADLVQVGLVNALVAGVSFVGMFAVLFTIDPVLAFVVLGVLPPVALLTAWYRKYAAVAYRQARERLSAVNGYLAESIAGIPVTQAFAREDENLRRFSALGMRQREASVAGARVTAVYVSAMELLSVLAIAATLAVGGARVGDGLLPIGALLAFLLYLAQVFAPIQQLSQVFDVYQRAKVGLDRIRDLLARPQSTPVAPDAKAVTAITGEVKLDKVTLRYATARADALRGVDLTIPAGQRVALVGRTGAGKSTIAKLVTRFYDPTQGTVAVDDQPLRSLQLATYRQRLGYVPQEPFLFSRTIRDNIAYACPGATDPEIEAAARAVGAHEFISRLPGGYLHRVSDRGRSLSAGQRQLVCLARALLADPAILILDEATSSLDLSGERRVNQAMQVVSKRRTTLVVTHRPQALAWVDRVLTVADGRIVADHATAPAADAPEVPAARAS